MGVRVTALSLAAAACAAVLAVWPVSGAASLDQPPEVRLVRLPEGAVQPRVAVDDQGRAHLIYFTGNPVHGDVFYTRVRDDGTLTPPLRVNRPGTAIATGTVRGATIAVGRAGRPHVAWMGSSQAGDGPEGARPMLYTRLGDSGDAFEPERNVMQFAVGLDGGGVVAADTEGRVYVAWHAGGPGSEGEGDRRVWVARSTDDGQTFSREAPASRAATGACGCCGLGALARPGGVLDLLYRSARDVVHRDTYLLSSDDGGHTFTDRLVDEWTLGACPMSTFALADGPSGVVGAWESEQQVFFAPLISREPIAAVAPAAGAAAPTGPRRHPAVAVNASGHILLAWSEGTGWQRGGGLAWQVFSADGRPLAESRRVSGVPVWSLSAAYAAPDGHFVIVY